MFVLKLNKVLFGELIVIFNNDPEINRLGYFQIGNCKTYSKAEGHRLAKQQGADLEFIFNNDVYQHVDWTTEPSSDIYELYKKRAEMLREKYDYLVLMFSGGIDSHTILRSFLDNGILLDEVVSIGNPSVVGKTTKKGLNQEVFRKAIPFVESANLAKHGTVYRFIDISQMMLDHTTHPASDDLGWYSFSTSLWKNIVTSHVFKSNVKDHVNIVNTGKRVCYIWGHEKPTILLNSNNEWYTEFSDFAIDHSVKVYYTKDVFKNSLGGFYDEPFYKCREMPEITLKQCHMLIQEMKTISEDSPYLRKVYQLPMYGPFVQFNETEFLPKWFVDKTIYYKEDVTQFFDDKIMHGSKVFSKKDRWYWNANNTNVATYLDRVKDVVTSDPDLFQWFNWDPNKPSIKTVFSTRKAVLKPYILGKKPLND